MISFTIKKLITMINIYTLYNITKDIIMTLIQNTV